MSSKFSKNISQILRLYFLILILSCGGDDDVSPGNEIPSGRRLVKINSVITDQAYSYERKSSFQYDAGGRLYKVITIRSGDRSEFKLNYTNNKATSIDRTFGGGRTRSDTIIYENGNIVEIKFGQTRSGSRFTYNEKNQLIKESNYGDGFNSTRREFKYSNDTLIEIEYFSEGCISYIGGDCYEWGEITFTDTLVFDSNPSPFTGTIALGYYFHDPPWIGGPLLYSHAPFILYGSNIENNIVQIGDDMIFNYRYDSEGFPWEVQVSTPYGHFKSNLIYEVL